MMSYNTEIFFETIRNELKNQKIVTFKWISRNFNLHSTLAKKCLKDFEEKEPAGKYLITYLIMGKGSNNELSLILTSQAVEKKLVKENIQIIDKYVYSIQLPDSSFDSLLMYDMDKSIHKEREIELSSIKYPTEIICKERKHVGESNNCLKEAANLHKTDFVSSANVMNGDSKSSQTSNNRTRNESIKLKDPKRENISQSSIKANNKFSAFFKPNSASREAAIEGNSHSEIAKSIKKENDPLSNNSCKKSIPSFFKPAVTKEENGDKENLSHLNTGSHENSVVLFKPTVGEQAEYENIQSKKKTTNKTRSSVIQNTVKNSGKRNERNSKKLKRIIAPSSTDSDDESDKSDSLFELEEPEPSPPASPRRINEEILSDKPGDRRRKRKIVEETGLDERGYFCTTKKVIYESCDSEEETSENTDTKRSKTETPLKTYKMTSEDVNKLVVKRKQASILSFFKK